MTYKNGQLEIFNITAKEVDEIHENITKSYRLASKEVESQLAASYAKFLSGVDPDNYYSEMIKFQRLQKLQKSIADTMGDAFKVSNSATLEGEKLAMSNAYYRNVYQYQWFSNMNFIPMDEQLLLLSATGNLNIWKDIQNKAIAKISAPLINYIPQTGTLSELLVKNNTETLEALRIAINNGFIQKKPFREVAKDIDKVFYGPKGNGGVTYNALNIARTEGGRTLSLGYLQSTDQATAQGVEMEKEWDATLDNRTRQSHSVADGQRVGVKENFTVQGESLPAPRVGGSPSNVINCRCTAINIIDGVGPSIRRGRNPVTGENEVFEFKDFNAWADEHGLKYNASGRLVKK